MFISILSWVDEMNKPEPPKIPKIPPRQVGLKKKQKKVLDAATLATLWTRCDKCGTVLYIKHVKKNNSVCTTCGNHLLMTARDRVKSLIDRGTWRPLDETLSPCNPLNFSDQKSYNERLKEAQERTKLQDAIVTGTGILDTVPVALGVMDFNFMGGSMGSVVGEKITRLIELATRKGYVLILICASGGARMQEGVLSLMQMAKISAALHIHQSCANLLYISILTSPTTGGVTASFAMLGDLIFAEPHALIGFAGRRVIKQTLQLEEELPEDFQTAEYLFDHGLLDLIIPRVYLKGALSEVMAFYEKPPFRKRGHLPEDFQKPFDFLTEERVRRKYLNDKNNPVFEDCYKFIEFSGRISLLTRFLYRDSLERANVFANENKKSEAQIAAHKERIAKKRKILDEQVNAIEKIITDRDSSVSKKRTIDEEIDPIDEKINPIDTINPIEKIVADSKIDLIDDITIDEEIDPIDEKINPIDTINSIEKIVADSKIDLIDDITIDEEIIEEGEDTDPELLELREEYKRILEECEKMASPNDENIEEQEEEGAETYLDPKEIKKEYKRLLEECEEMASMYKDILISLNLKLGH